METRRILRLHHEGKSKRFIAEYPGISRNTVTKYINFYTISGLSYDEVNTMPNDQLDKLFSPKAVNIPERLADLQKGVYFITIRSKDFVTTRKIVKL